MYATLFVHTHPKGLSEEAQSELKSRIVPMVQKQPGFHSAIWSFDRASSRSYSHVMWDSEENAHRFYSFMKAQGGVANPHGIALESAMLTAVIAEAG
jgi:hypothetical protein